jgi:hypothetical protein
MIKGMAASPLAQKPWAPSPGGYPHNKFSFPLKLSIANEVFYSASNLTHVAVTRQVIGRLVDRFENQANPPEIQSLPPI